jgi:subtilisin inhibitor-like
MRRALAAMAGIAILAAPTCQGGYSATLELTVENASEQRSYTLRCDPNGGSHPDADAACLTLERHHEIMLADLHPGQTCIGGISTLHIRVSGKYRGKVVNGRPDACSGNLEGERLWMKDLPQLGRRG